MHQHNDKKASIILRNFKAYRKQIEKLKSRIESEPKNWGQYQKEVNVLIDSGFKMCRRYEEKCFDEPQKVDRLKKLFVKMFRPYINMGNFNRRVIDRPYGYLGDFYIIDYIYQNKASASGTERCLDNYFLNTPAAIATRNRKQDFKELFKDCLEISNGAMFKILNVGCGPCRDMIELLTSEKGTLSSTRFMVHSIDQDQRALNYAKQLVDEAGVGNNMKFIRLNVFKLALTKNINKYLKDKYDLIMSTGLFDYLPDDIAIKLIRNLRLSLNDDGKLIISNYTEKQNNPSRLYMEWGGDWKLIYRSTSAFKKLFIEAGFKESELKIHYEIQRIMQYCIAKN